LPELPEVATICNQLNAVLPLKIKEFSLSNVSDSIVHTPMNKLMNVTIEKVLRHGKMMIFELSDQRKLLCHLGMTGGWRITHSPLEIKHLHVMFTDGNTYLSYVDPRRFGHMYLYNEKDAKNKLSELGVDLLAPEFTLEYFTKTIKKYPERAIKHHLLDQKLYAGVGNYIANEICARGLVRPTRRNKTLTHSEIKAMYEATFIVLEGASSTGGTTFQGGYADTTGSVGGGVNHLVVFYQKTCQLCKKTPVKKIILNQRGTYYCPNCQK
jgi:formamidopyrimidine-DNA glycosylase